MLTNLFQLITKVLNKVNEKISQYKKYKNYQARAPVKIHQFQNKLGHLMSWKWWEIYTENSNIDKYIFEHF